MWRGPLLSYRKNGLGIQDKSPEQTYPVSFWIHSCLDGLTIPGCKDCSTIFMLFMPSLTLMKDSFISFFQHAHAILAVQMRNWGLFGLGSAFVMDTMPGSVGIKMKFPPSHFSSETCFWAFMVSQIHTLQGHFGKTGNFTTKSFLPSA